MRVYWDEKRGRLMIVPKPHVETAVVKDTKSEARHAAVALTKARAEELARKIEFVLQDIEVGDDPTAF